VELGLLNRSNSAFSGTSGYLFLSMEGWLWVGLVVKVSYMVGLVSNMWGLFIIYVVDVVCLKLCGYTMGIYGFLFM